MFKSETEKFDAKNYAITVPSMYLVRQSHLSVFNKALINKYYGRERQKYTERSASGIYKFACVVIL